jgi:hypothetical protein
MVSGFFTTCKKPSCSDGQGKGIQSVYILDIYSNTGGYEFFNPKACNLLIRKLKAGLSDPLKKWI